MPRAADGSTTRPACFQQQPHAGDDATPPDQDGVVGDLEEVVQDRGDGEPAGDAVGDGVDRVGGDDTALVPGTGHRRCTQGLDADHLDAGRQGLSGRDPRRWPWPRRPGRPGPRRTSEPRVGEFQADRGRALAGLDVEAVLDQADAAFPRDGDGARPHGDGALPGQLEVPVDQLQFRPQGTDPSSLAGGRPSGMPPPSRPGRGVAPDQARAWPRLPALAHTTAARPCRASRVGDQLGAPGLEAAHRVRRLQLDTHRAPELTLQRVARVQRRVQEDRVDHPTSRTDPVQVQTRRGHAGNLSERGLTRSGRDWRPHWSRWPRRGLSGTAESADDGVVQRVDGVRVLARN